MDPLIIFFGLAVGVLVGLTGIGGGSLLTPLLILVVGVKPVVAIGTDLFYGAVTKTVGGWRHLRQGTVDLGVSGWMALGSVPGSLLGVLALNVLQAGYGDAYESVLLGFVAAALLVVSLAILGRAVFMRVFAESEAVELTPRLKTSAVLIGLTLGALIGLTSVGSGALIGLALILVFRLTPHRVVGTDVFHAALLLWTAALAHLAAGNVDLALAGTLLVGSIPGVWLGAALLPLVPAAGLRPALGCVLLGAALGLLGKAGVELPAAVIVGVPLAAGALAFAVHRIRREEAVVPA
ncbi:MAG: sulfite exporter TauE/SafE family protein [Actinomycetota bacterium]|nr:sulfite exporter TauE/SafE family protein [Actinomycetota bacterium]